MSPDLIRYSLADTMTLSFHLGREPFQDKKVREAFAYALDREAYCQDIANGTCVPAYSWIPQGTPGAIETDAYAFDPARAREALAASSYHGPENLPEIALAYVPEWPSSVAESEWLVEQYQKNLGVELALEPIAADDLFSRFSTAESWPDLAFWGWTQDYPDPQNWISITWACDSTMLAGIVGYCNEAVDELIRQADAEPNPESRMALYEEAGRLIVEDAPVLFVSSTETAVLVQPYVVGYVTTPRDHWPGMASLLTIDLAVETVPAA
jgi:oligopeptide transport system substrate-binding protein